jgi:GNAT superfamily N-acetyltransferase
MEFSIRQISPSDVAAIKSLSQQLGYTLSEEQTLQNIKAVLENNDHNAFVAVSENQVVGWIGMTQAIMLELTPHCEINGLVIDEKYRGHGIGKLLIEKAKQWAREKGNDKLCLRCNVIRKETHLFYKHLGFVETKEQKRFEIKI